MRRILHASDFSPASRAAFATALALAKNDRAELIVTHVLAPMASFGYGAISSDAYGELEAANRRDATTHLDELVGEAKSSGVRVRSLLLEGIAAEEIVRAARRRHADLIVIGTHGQTGFARFFVGTVANRVIARARCPVMTVRGHGRRKP